MSGGLFSKAAEVLRTRGGSQRVLVNSNEQVCLVGAVCVAAGADLNELRELGSETIDNYDLNEDLGRLASLGAELFPDIADELEGQTYGVYYVNDHKGREAAQQLLDEAAVREARGEL